MKLGRYWHTLRYLKPVQFYGRVWFRLYKPRPDLSAAPQIREPSGCWVAPARRKPSLSGPQDFVFLGEHGRLENVGWEGPQREKLWRYNQHYFDDLNAKDAAQRIEWHRALLVDWVRANPPGLGNAWEPYPTSLRIVNWVKWALDGNELPEPCIHSLAVQARWLTNRLEIHLLGNHLFANAKALVFAGLFFTGKEADGWLRKGMQILAREMPEQILPDGGHIERSTMYHALALEDMLDLCNVTACHPAGLGLTGTRQLDDLRQRVEGMQRWLKAMCHPDGEIGFFNDAALGIAPTLAELDAYAKRLFPTLTSSWELPSAFALPNSGYVRMQRADAVALVDVAPVGPDYLPGHAHADTLSFELSVGAQRVLVNSGTSCYGTSNERLRQRGTAAHNTVVIDGLDSSEVWGGFRVAQRARPIGLTLSEVGDVAQNAIELCCAHDGYQRLSGKPTHWRRWLMREGEYVVEDSVEGGFEGAEARFHFHPDLKLVPLNDAIRGEVYFPNGRVLNWRAECEHARLEDATWHPRFGASVPNVCLVIRLAQGHSRFTLITL
jgi:uncharacterized heparinase superfamily protein